MLFSRRICLRRKNMTRVTCRNHRTPINEHNRTLECKSYPLTFTPMKNLLPGTIFSLGYDQLSLIREIVTVETLANSTKGFYTNRVQFIEKFPITGESKYMNPTFLDTKKIPPYLVLDTTQILDSFLNRDNTYNFSDITKFTELIPMFFHTNQINVHNIIFWNDTFHYVLDIVGKNEVRAHNHMVTDTIDKYYYCKQIKLSLNKNESEKNEFRYKYVIVDKHVFLPSMFPSGIPHGLYTIKPKFLEPSANISMLNAMKKLSSEHHNLDTMNDPVWIYS